MEVHFVAESISYPPTALHFAGAWPILVRKSFRLCYNLSKIGKIENVVFKIIFDHFKIDYLSTKNRLYPLVSSSVWIGDTPEDPETQKQVRGKITPKNKIGLKTQ